MELNEFSRLIRNAWDNKYPDANAPSDGAILNLAKSVGFDIEICYDVLAGLSEDVKASFSTFMAYCKEDSAKHKRMKQSYITDEYGNQQELRTGKDGKQYYNVSVPKSDEEARIWRGFQLNPDYEIKPESDGMSKEKQMNNLKKQLDHLHDTKQFTDEMYNKALIGLKIFKGEIDFDDKMHYNKPKDDLPF